MLSEILHEIVDMIRGAKPADDGALADLHAAIDKALPDDKGAKRTAPGTTTAQVRPSA
jgi:hypothetical protein